MKRLVALAAALLVTAGCGGQQVGSKNLLDVKGDKNQTGAGLGAIVGSPSPGAAAPQNLGQQSQPQIQPAQPQQPQQAAPVTQPQRTTTQPPPTAPQLTITINPDGSGATPQFDPSGALIHPGTRVVWVNKDIVARGVDATVPAGAFKSPSIPPGGSWSYTFASPGNFQYEDSTRPYATGSIQVK
ncbi:MAG: hypothetical protein ABR598_02295 [Candidatus Dormibacteria bacterium]